MAEKMPKSPPPPPAWLTEIPARSYQSGGTFKHHRNVGHAKNSITTFTRYGGYRLPNVCTGGKIYKWDFDRNEWELVYDIPEGTLVTDLPWITKD